MTIKSSTYRNIWLISVIMSIVVIIITYSPLILKEGKILPGIGGFPFSLWTGILLTIILVINTAIAARYFFKQIQHKTNDISL